MKLCTMCGALAPDNFSSCPMCGSYIRDEISVDIPISTVKEEEYLQKNTSKKSSIELLDDRIYELEKKLDVVEEKVYELEEILWSFLITLIKSFNIWDDIKEQYISEGRKKDAEFIESIRKEI